MVYQDHSLGGEDEKLPESNFVVLWVLQKTSPPIDDISEQVGE